MSDEKCVSLWIPGRRTGQVAKTALVSALIFLTFLGSIGTVLPGIFQAFFIQPTAASALCSSTTPDATTAGKDQGCSPNGPGSNSPRRVGADALPNLSLPKTVLSSVNSLVSSGGVVESSSENLTLHNLAISLRLLGGSRSHDELLGPGRGVLSSWSSWTVQANITGLWTPLAVNSNNFTLMGTNRTGTFIARTMQVNTGSYSGTFRIVYKALSTGSLKWDLEFTPSNLAQYRLVFAWWNITGPSFLDPVQKRFEATYPFSNYTFSWNDVPSIFKTSPSASSGLFSLSIDLGTISRNSTVIVDPTIAPSVESGATSFPSQRHVFYEPKAGNWWVFYNNGSGVSYRYSSTGVSWSPAYSIPGWPGWIDDFASSTSILNAGTSVFVVAGQTVYGNHGSPWTANVSVFYANGTVSGNSISWSPVQTLQTFSATCNDGYSCQMELGFWLVSLALSSDGNLVITYGFIQAQDVALQSGAISDYYNDTLLARYKGSLFNLATQSGFASSFLGANSGAAAYSYSSSSVGVDATGGVRTIFSSGSSSLSAVFFTGTSKGPTETITTSSATWFSVVADSLYTVHVVYTTGSNSNGYAYRNAGSSQWVIPSDSPFTGTYPTLTIDYGTNDIYAFAIQGSSIVMREKTPNHLWSDQSPVFPVTGRVNPKALGSNYGSISGTNSSQISIIWTEGNNPFSAMFASIPIQTIWSPYAFPSDPWNDNGLAPYGQYFANLGEYVSPSTGMLTVKQTDLNTAGRGLGLDIARVYTEPYSFFGSTPYNFEKYPWAPIGNGWQLNFPWLNNTNYPLYIHLWDGEGYRIPSSFWSGFTATFENHQGENFRLVRNSDGSILLYIKTGVSYTFDSSHKLTRISDPTGNNNITFNYANNFISCISDTIGRPFSFNYSMGLLQGISQLSGSCTNPGSLIRSLLYKNNGQSLISVTDPAGRTTTYSYDSTSWLLSQITYPTKAFDIFVYAAFVLGTQATSYRVIRQSVQTSPSSTVRMFTYGYTQGAGDQVTGSTVTTSNGTLIVSSTNYAFSYKGVSWNVTDPNGFVRGVEQLFGVHGEVPREIVLLSPTQGYTNYYRYDIWGNRIYSRQVINPSTNQYHESFNAYYNNGLPPGFNAFQETFSQLNGTSSDNPWLTYNGTWLVRNGVYNGTSPIFNPTHQEGFFAWTNFTSPNTSIIASIYVTKPMVSSDGRVGLIAHYTGSGMRKWALVLHNSIGGVKLSLLDEYVAWKVENPCTLNFNSWYQFNFTISGKNAWGSATALGVSCSVSGSFTSNDISASTGLGLYAGGYSALFDNVTVTTVAPGITGTSFSNSFIPSGSPSSNVHGTIAGKAELQNGTGTMPIETYYSYYAWGGLNQVKNRYDPAGGTQWISTSRTYDAYGNPAVIADSRGNKTYYTYSPSYSHAYLTNQTRVMIPVSTQIIGSQITALYGYDNNTGAMVWYQDPNLYKTVFKTLYQYDTIGRITRVAYPTGDFTAYKYNDTANYVEVTNENGWKTRQIYDGLARLSSVQRFSGSTSYLVTYTYNWMDKVTAKTDPVGNTYRYQYDVLGRTVTVVKPDNNSTLVSYNDLASWVRSTDESGVYGCRVTDRLGRLISVVENATSDCQSGMVSNYFYDEVGNLLNVASSTAQLTAYAYDNLNRLTRTSFPDRTTESYSYDANGNLVSRIDRKGSLTSYSYDSRDKVTVITHVGMSPDSYNFDADGNLLSLQSQNATIGYNYDLRDRITSETYSINAATSGGGGGGGGGGPHPRLPTTSSSVSTSYSVGYSYNGEVLDTITYPDNVKVKYTYDGLGRVLTVANASIAAFTYYPNDLVKSIVFGNGKVGNYTYDSLSRTLEVRLRPTTISTWTTTILLLDYSYNKTGTVARVTGQVNLATVNEQYRYDALGRLLVSNVTSGGTGKTTANSMFQYKYDSAGNRVWQSLNGRTTSYRYNVTNNELQSSNGAVNATYSYDPKGNLKAESLATASWAYTWDSASRLGKAANNGATQGLYAYDGMGRRIESVESSTIFYAYYGTETLSEIVSGGATTDYVYAAGLRLAKITGTTTNYYHTDALGSTRLVTDSSSKAVFADGYQSYGQDNGTPSGLETYKFTGKPYSTATGLYYDYQRWYDNSTGRFLSEDPIAGYLSDPQSQNGYVYVENLPTVVTDPTGAVSCPDTPTACEGGPVDIAPLSDEELNGIQDLRIREFCGDNPLACRGFNLLSDDDETPTGGADGGCLCPTTGDSPSGDSPPRPPTTTVTDTTTPTIDTNPTTSDLSTPSTTENIDNVGHFINTEENGGYEGEFQNHHLLPRQFEGYYDIKGLTIDDYTMNLDANVHRIIHGKGIGYEASWNGQWGAFIGNNPNASPDDIISYLYWLMYEFGLQ